ncbi:MAG: cytochrome P460 family protein [Acidobacteria bacterium]|nr:cytochrome P460 family protein [Acidobacteriota bacterium]
MTKRITALVLLLCAFALSALSLWVKAEDAVPYPAGYRQWVHVSSALVGPQAPGFAVNGGIHHIYANEKALAGYRTGRFPDGSVLVADFLETKENNGVTTEAARRRIDVMVKDSQRYAATGGWGFEQFRGDSQTERLVTAEGAAKCFACHASQKETDAVFSKFRE